MDTSDRLVTRFDDVVSEIETVLGDLYALQGLSSRWSLYETPAGEPLCWADIDEMGLPDMDAVLMRKQLLSSAVPLCNAVAALIDIANNSDVEPILARLNKCIEAARPPDESGDDDDSGE